MATTYNVIERQCAIRINALIGIQPSDLATTYSTVPLTNTNYQSAIFIRDSVLDAMLNTEGRLAATIAQTGNHPLRAYLMSVTAALVNGDELPSIDVNSKQIIGVWGSVQDSSDGKVCRRKSLAEIQRRIRNAGSAHVVPVYWFEMDDLNIYHTRTSVTAKVCVYSRTVQAAAIVANGPMLLPDTEADAMVEGTVAQLVRDNAFMEQARLYRDYFDSVTQDIKGGLTSAPSKAFPVPVPASV